MRAPSIITGFVLLVTLAFSVDLASAGQDRREQPDEASTAEEPAGDSVGHKEVPVDPPAVPVNRSSQARSPRAIAVRGSYQSFQVNVDGAQNNIVGDAANEPTIAVDPTNPDIMVIGWRQFDTIASRRAWLTVTTAGRRGPFPGRSIPASSAAIPCSPPTRSAISITTASAR
jgi:hypothetical protein